MAKLKVVHYINQFFAQIGGEEKADYPAELRKGEVVGPGLALMEQFGEEAEIIATIVCGDTYFNENMDSATAQVLEWVKAEAPDVFIAGPAFNAGRYGVACATVAAHVQQDLGIPSLTGMYVENPGVDMFKDKVLMVSTKNSAAGMRKAVKTMAPLALKLAKGEKIGASCEEGYIPNSRSKQSIRCRSSTVSHRTRPSRTWRMRRSLWLLPAVLYRRAIRITSRAPVHPVTVSTSWTASTA